MQLDLIDFLAQTPPPAPPLAVRLRVPVENAPDLRSLLPKRSDEWEALIRDVPSSSIRICVSPRWTRFIVEALYTADSTTHLAETGKIVSYTHVGTPMRRDIFMIAADALELSSRIPLGHSVNKHDVTILTIHNPNPAETEKVLRHLHQEEIHR